MDLCGQTVSAAWTWLNGRFEADAQIQVDDQGGIVAIRRKEQCGHVVPANLQRLEHMALLPGFVNAHSHAFHRCLRGRSQIGSLGADNFWKWRQNMYGLVESVDFERLKKMCADTFREMLSAGITTVGEFHYVHHADTNDSSSSGGNDGRYALDMAVVEAALEVGIRLVLIETLYMRAGFTTDRVGPEQWRFASTSVDEFIAHVERLREAVDKRQPKNAQLISVALAVHSLRAVPVAEARQLFQFALRQGLPLHIHLEEQPGELEQCRAAHQGQGPGQLLLREIVGDEQQDLQLLTAVHCTHSERPLMDELARRGVNICICPCTEGYLGDGVPVLEANDRLCLGTDCNNRIAMLEEMRWMAFCQNMRTNTRNVGALDAAKLLEAATINGAKSLGLSGLVGDFSAGKFMDFLALDLQSPRLAQFVNNNGQHSPRVEEKGEGISNSSGQLLLDAIVFGAGNAEVLMSGVAGQMRFGRGGIPIAARKQR